MTRTIHCPVSILFPFDNLLRFDNLTAIGALSALVVAVLVATGVARAGDGATVQVSDAAGASRALAGAKPGTTVVLAPGKYGTIRLAGVRGAEKQPVTLRAADPKQPPVFENVPVAMHLSK